MKSKGRPKESLLDRVYKHVVKLENGCWNWVGFSRGNRPILSLRVGSRVVSRSVRSILVEALFQHKNNYCKCSCDTPKCVNPYHIYRYERGTPNVAA